MFKLDTQDRSGFSRLVSKENSAKITDYMLYRLIHCCLYFTVRSLSKWTVGKYCWFFYLPVSRFSTAFREEDRQVSVGMEKPIRNVQKVTTTKERSSVASETPPPPPPGKKFRSEMSKREEKFPPRYVGKKECARSAQIPQN